MESMDAESDLWNRYRSGGDDAARDRLMLRYMPWATAIARSVHRRVRAYQVDRDDFVQNATIGLLEAMSRFDPERGIAFRYYAQPRIRGAVFNGLRAILGDRPQASDQARFEARLANLNEGAGGDSFDGFVDTVVGLGVGYLLDEAVHARAADSGGALSYAQKAELEASLLAAIGALPDRLKLIVELHYFRYVPFQEVAKQMGVTKGRISQLHKSALMKLRDHLRSET